jgi:uncharacterized protein (DUF3820 family)
MLSSHNAVLSVLWFTAFDYPFGILATVLSVLWFTASDYPFGILATVLEMVRTTTEEMDHLFNQQCTRQGYDYGF